MYCFQSLAELTDCYYDRGLAYVKWLTCSPKCFWLSQAAYHRQGWRRSKSMRRHGRGDDWPRPAWVTSLGDESRLLSRRCRQTAWADIRPAFWSEWVL